MQQLPSGEDPYKRHMLPQKPTYIQRALEPLQDPYTRPIREAYPAAKPPVHSPKRKLPKKRATAIGVVLSVLGLLCLSVIVFAVIVNQNLSQQAVTNDNNDAVVVATMPPQQTIASNLLATAPSTRPLEWITTHIFEGNGNQQTETFQIGDTWKILWSCGAGTTTENVLIDARFSDGTVLDPAAINTVCNIGNNNGSIIEHQGGSVYLDVISKGGWSIRIQEQQ